MSLPPLPDIDLTSLRAAISDLRVGGHLSMDGNSRLIDELSNLRTVARSYAEEAVKQERERFAVVVEAAEYGIAAAYDDCKPELAEKWGDAIRARSSMESK